MENTIETPNQNPTKEKKSKKLIFTIVGIVLLLGAAFFAYKKISYAMQNEDTENSQIQANIVPIAPRISGYVAAIYISDNQFVKAGDTLIKLDDRDLKIKVEQAEINLENAKANVAVVKGNISSADASANAVSSSVATAQANIATAQANVEAAKVRAWNANENFKRIEQLYNLTSATKQQYDQALTEKQAADNQVIIAQKQVTVAQTQLNAAKQQSNASKTQANSINTQVDVAQINIKQREQDVAFAKLQLSYAYVIAPYDGYIAKKNVQIGQLLNPGQIICSIVDENKLWIVANFKETQIEKMKVGQEVEVKVDAYPKAKIVGKVESIQAATGSTFSLLPADNSTGNFVKVVQRIPVKILLDKNQGNDIQLKAGMNVKVAVKVK
ncbi:MAG: HlyD family secretion protein [Chitinophagales bacterium]|nr:HlyD family secretion protein [Chitinophagales bacterium]